MRKILIIAAISVLGGCSTVNYFGRIDILCSGGFKPVRLKEDFKSPQGATLPKGTVIYLRECQYGNQGYLPVVIEPSFIQSYEPEDRPKKEQPLHSLEPISAGG